MSLVEGIGLILLAVFIMAVTVGGAQISAAVGWYSFGGASFIVSLILSWDGKAST